MAIKFATCALIFNKEGKILGVSRKDNREDFGLPGGKLDGDETLLECLCREVKEETGLDVLRYQDAEPLMVFGNLSDTKGYYVSTYMCKVTGELHTPEKIVELGEGDIKWVDWSEIETGFNGSYNRYLHYFINKMITDEGLTLEEFNEVLSEDPEVFPFN